MESLDPLIENIEQLRRSERGAEGLVRNRNSDEGVEGEGMKREELLER